MGFFNGNGREINVQAGFHNTLIQGAFVESGTDLSLFTGKRIHSIDFKKIDIIEGSVLDTTKKARSDGIVFLNKIHHDTRDNIIKNQLLFKEGDLLDPMIISDNERILRNLPYIQNARIVVVPSENDSSAVDILVITQDLFPWGIKGGGASLQSFHGELYTRNVDGLGLEAGFLSEALAGIEKNEFYTRNYGGVRTAYAGLNKNMGYFLFQAEFGTYMNDGKAEDGMVVLTHKYFSKLYDWGWTKNRNFLTVTYIEPMESRYIFFFNKRDIHMYGADSLWGDEKLVVNVENVMFLK